MVDNIFKFILWLYSIRLFHIKFKSPYVIFFCLSTIFIIFLNGGIEFVFASDIASELGSSTIYSGDRFIESREVFLMPPLSNGVKAGKFVNNHTFKFRGGVEKFLLLQQLKGILMSLFNLAITNQVGDTAADQSADSGCQKSNIEFGHFSYLMLMALIVSVVISCIMGIFYIFFTQQFF